MSKELATAQQVLILKFALGPEKSAGLSKYRPSRAKVIHLYNMVKYSRVKLSHYFKLFFHDDVFLWI